MLTYREVIWNIAKSRQVIEKIENLENFSKFLSSSLLPLSTGKIRGIVYAVR